MLSIYYRSLGRQFEIQGAPSVLLPPEIEPQSLEDALQILSSDPARLREGVWRIARTVPPNSPEGIQAYPAALFSIIGSAGLEKLNAKRRHYRSGANLFGAALVACRDENWDQFDQLVGLMRQFPNENFSTALRVLVKRDSAEFLTRMKGLSPQARDRARDQIRSLENEVGLNIHDLTENLADAAAFQDFSLNESYLPKPHTGSTIVYPVALIISQEREALISRVTVTTLVNSDYAALRFAVDPLNWGTYSDVIRKSEYVMGPFDLRAASVDRPKEVNGKLTTRRFMNEEAEILWGPKGSLQGAFHNILNVEVIENEHEDLFDVNYTLCRSIRSRVLWDERAGGLLRNEGYLKVRPLGEDCWRVTIKKVLKFDDRTPFANAAGWLDFGQFLNYFAPAGLAWWLESETYRIGDPPGPSNGKKQDSGRPGGMSVGDNQQNSEQGEAWDRLGGLMQQLNNVATSASRRSLDVWGQISRNLRSESYGTDAMARDAVRMSSVLMENMYDMCAFWDRDRGRAGSVEKLPTAVILFDRSGSIKHRLVEEMVVPLDAATDKGRELPERAMIALNGTSSVPIEEQKPHDPDPDQRGTTEVGIAKLLECIIAVREKQSRAYTLEIADRSLGDVPTLVQGVYDGIVYLVNPPLALANLRILVEGPPPVV